MRRIKRRKKEKGRAGSSKEKEKGWGSTERIAEADAEKESCGK